MKASKKSRKNDVFGVAISNLTKLRFPLKAQEKALLRYYASLIDKFAKTFPLSKANKNYFLYFADILRQISNLNSSSKAKNLLQKGGGPLLVALLGIAVAEVVSRVADKLLN